jgi:hypothetical protein
MCWAPTSVISGDLICIFQGYAVPFLLRPAPGGYRLLGDSYILDHMNGKAWGFAPGDPEVFKLV